VHSQKPQLTGGTYSSIIVISCVRLIDFLTEKPTSFFEQFIVVGVKKENGTKVQDPELLFQYPKVYVNCHFH
jgi:hypothetical protein